MAALPLLERFTEARLGGGEFFLQLMKLVFRLFDLSVHRLGVLGFQLLPIAIGFLKFLLRGIELLLNRLRELQRSSAQFLIQSLLLMTHAGLQNFFVRHPSEIPSQSKPFQQHDGPLRRIKMPRFDTVPIVILKGVMKIVISLAEREQGGDSAVAGR